MIDHNKNNPTRRRYERAYTLRKQFGLSFADYEAMRQAQGGKCKICLQEPQAPMKYLSVDHDHVTGKIRGLLCKACNLALGNLQDSPDRLRRAAEYLEAAA